MLPFFVAFVTATQSAQSSKPTSLGDSAWIVSTVGHSEWCPAGNVRLDLRTGEYLLTPAASRRVCNDANLERPVKAGKLGTDRYDAIRAASLRVIAEGLENPVCREGRRPEQIIVSNGGTPVLVLTIGVGTSSAPDDLTCWSKAANDLHRALEDAFSSFRER